MASSIFRYSKNVRGEDCFIGPPTCPPVGRQYHGVADHASMPCGACRRGASRRDSVLRLCAQGSQRSSARADFVEAGGDLITEAGAHRVLLFDLHAGQIQGFFDIPADHLFAAPVLVATFKS